MPQLDSPGIYKAKIQDSTFGFTKNRYPQVLMQLLTTHAYVENSDDLAHYKLDAPGWVEYPEESILYAGVLFNDADVYTEDSALRSYEDLQKALGWDGLSFAPLADDTFRGREVLIRCEEDEYQGKVRLRVQSIDAPDASPHRGLRDTDPEDLRVAESRLQIQKAKPKPRPVVAKPKPKSEPRQETPPPAEPSPEAAIPTRPKRSSGEAVVKSIANLPDSQAKCWESIVRFGSEQKSTEQQIEAAYMAALDTVAPEIEEDEIAPAQWGEVYQHAVEKLAAEDDSVDVPW